MRKVLFLFDNTDMKMKKEEIRVALCSAILLYSTNINLYIIFSMTNQSKAVRIFNRVIYFCLLTPDCFDASSQIFCTPFHAACLNKMFEIPNGSGEKYRKVSSFSSIFCHIIGT